MKHIHKSRNIKKIIGKELWNKLTSDQKILMIKTCGIIDLTNTRR